MSESFQNLKSELEDKEYAHGYFDEHLNEYIATQIKVLREEREWTQERLAEESGMAQERISVLEDVNYPSWTVNTLRKIAWAFDLRLHVSFETFGSGIEQLISFSADALKRKSREEELGFLETQAKSASEDNKVANAIYSQAQSTNAQQSSSQGLIFIRSYPDPTESKDNETTLRKPSASDLALPIVGSKSARQSYREKRAA
jgi:transcriptional regulator with XRE-family HTH domain